MRLTAAQWPKEGSAGVSWEAHDANLDLATLAVEYRLKGEQQWRPVRVPAQAKATFFWEPAAFGEVEEARVRVRDRAGNAAEAQKELTVLPPGASW